MTIRLVLDPVRLRHARLEAALSQAALAEQAGVHENTVTAAERGVCSTTRTIRLLAKALDVKPTDIAAVIDRSTP